MKFFIDYKYISIINGNFTVMNVDKQYKNGIIF